MRKRLLTVGAIAIFLMLVVLAASTRGQIAGPQGLTASFTYSPSAPMPGDIITFDASSSYASSGIIVSYTWDFGDGTVLTVASPTVTHSYIIDGTYTVQLTVTDSNAARGTSVAVIDIRTVIFFRVIFYGTLIPLAGAKVTVYYNATGTWIPAPVGQDATEIKYDNMTQSPPHLANTAVERFRNPGFSASVIWKSASNIGFDLHQQSWSVFFKFEWGPWTAYWPNETTRVYSYKNGAVETHDYLPGHRASWNSAASSYVIRVSDIPGNGVSPTDSSPIIVGIFCPPPPQQYYLTVNTDPPGITTIPGQGWYNQGTNVALTAPSNVNISANAQYRFNFWDVDGASQGVGVNSITVTMNTNHTATAHYVMQYSVIFNQAGLSADATGTVVTVNGTPKSSADLPFTYWVDNRSIVTYSYSSIVSSNVTGKHYTLNGVTGPSSPMTVTGPSTVSGSYVTQYLVIFAQTGLDGNATGKVVTVNSTALTYSQLPFNWWVDSGSTITYSYSTIVSSNVTGKQFRLTGVHSPTSPFVVTGSVTITGSYCIQYKITFTHTGLDPTVMGTVVTVNGSAEVYSNLPYIDWFDSGASVSYSCSDTLLTNVTGKQFKLINVTGAVSPFTVTSCVTLTGNYKTQYQVTFDEAGVGDDFTGTVVTVDSLNYNVTLLPVSFWWDQSSTHSFSFSSPLVVNASMQYAWNSTSGLSSLKSGNLTIATSGTVVGNYVVANCITFDQTGASSDFTGTVLEVDNIPYNITTLPVSFAWQVGSAHNFTFHSPMIVNPSLKQYVWTSTSGLSTSQDGSITLTTYGSIVGHYGTQYYLTLTTSPPGVASPSGAGWYDAGSYASISAPEFVDIVLDICRYKFCNWTAAYMGEITNSTAPTTTVLMDQGKAVTANYAIQYKVTFGQLGIGTDFVGTVVNIDGTDYTRGALPASFWWNSGSSHSFSFSSPLVVNVSTQYVWNSTSGLKTLQNGTLAIASSGSMTGNYILQTKYLISFGCTGVGSDFTDTVVTVDGVNYDLSELNASFWWDSDSNHTFSYASPLAPTTDKQYVWTSTSGLSTLQGGSIVVSGSGSVTGNYKTQYYLTLTTNPSGVTSPSGAGWYDAGTNATVSIPTGFVDIVPGCSRYRFNGWTTANMTEIADPTRSPTNVTMDEAKTVTANYVAQYVLVFKQTAVGADFTGTVVAIDTINYNVTSLPATFFWDNGTTHSFDFKSPLIVTPNAKRYAWASTSGLSTQQSDFLVVMSCGNITGNYKTQYYLTVATSPPGIATIPGEGWYNDSASVALTAPPVSNYSFAYWLVNGVSQGPGVNPITLTMNIAQNATVQYTPITPYVLTIITTSGGTTNPSPSTYTYSSGTTVQVTALPNSGYVLDHWELYSTNVSSTINPIPVLMNMNHTLIAVFSIAPPPPSVTISPLDSTVAAGGSVSFTSSVSGGTAPYSYQWYLDGAPVSGATSASWTFTPPSMGMYFVYLKVTDANDVSAVSSSAKVTVVSVPVGGYSVSLAKHASVVQALAYSTLVCLFAAALIVVKRKRK